MAEYRGIGFTSSSVDSGGVLGGSKNAGRNNNSMVVVVVADKMEYDAEAIAHAMSVTVIENLVAGLDRGELVELLNLETDWPLVADIKGIHPPSLTAPKTLRIHMDECPFLEAGTSSDCCTGSIIGRSGHSTISMPCYRTDLLADNSLCEHCQQLWAAHDEEGYYMLDPKTMDKAALFYKAGRTGVLRKWQEIVGASAVFEEEIQSAKEVFADSTDQLDKSFPGMDFSQFCKEVLNNSGVLFADAGRSRNPYRRSQVQQVRIGRYVQRMAVLWVRVKSAVPQAIFDKFMSDLRATAGKIEQAARWTVQKTFPQYPVFVGPLVCADIMLAGFLFAEARYHHQVGRVMQNTQDARDLSDISMGPVIARLVRWASTVKSVKRASPVKRKPAAEAAKATAAAAGATPLWDAAASADASVARDLNPAFNTPLPDMKSAEHARASPPKSTHKSGKAPVFYGVARGFKPGVYTSWDEANTQVKNYSGFRVRKFKSEIEAEHYVAEAQANPQKVWHVLKGSQRDGAYESRDTALIFRCLGSTLVERNSLTAAKRFLGKSRIQVYRTEEEKNEHTSGGEASESSAAPPSSQESAASAGTQHRRQFFACKGGAEARVFASLKDVLAAVKKGGGTFEAFETEAEAAAYCRPPDVDAGTSDTEDMYVVWAGKSTGVMTATECVSATAGVLGAEADGPMTQDQANALWIAKKLPHRAPAAETQDLKHVQYPTQAEWSKAIDSKSDRVFACWIAPGKGRIAFTWQAATRGLTKNLSVDVFSSEATLFLNFARAEEFLSQSKAAPSIKEQIAAARKSISKSPKTRGKMSAAPARAAPASKSSATGQSVGVRVGMSGVVHTREASQIRRCFVDAASAVEVRGAPDEPDDDDLDINMPAPGEATYLAKDVEEQVDGAGGLTMFDYYTFKKGKVKAWPLKNYDEFLSFCRQGQKLCASSSTEVGAANAAMFHELLDIAVRTHGQMLRRGTLGVNEIRFQVRMYLHLQYATNHCVLHTGASAMRAFEDAVDSFGVAKVPRFKLKIRSTGADRSAQYGTLSRKYTPANKKTSTAIKPVSGCWRCPATDHYANDPKFHPKPASGKQPPLSDDVKKAIMDRIDASSLSAELKQKEKTDVKKFWAQHSL